MVILISENTKLTLIRSLLRKILLKCFFFQKSDPPCLFDVGFFSIFSLNFLPKKRTFLCFKKNHFKEKVTTAKKIQRFLVKNYEKSNGSYFQSFLLACKYCTFDLHMTKYKSGSLFYQKTAILERFGILNF